MLYFGLHYLRAVPVQFYMSSNRKYRVHNVNHSEAKALFVGSLVAEELQLPHAIFGNIINLDEFKILYSRIPKFPDTREHLNEVLEKISKSFC